VSIKDLPCGCRQRDDITAWRCAYHSGDEDGYQRGLVECDAERDAEIAEARQVIVVVDKLWEIVESMLGVADTQVTERDAEIARLQSIIDVGGPQPKLEDEAMVRALVKDDQRDAEIARLSNKLSQAHEVIQNLVDRWLRESNSAQQVWIVPAADSEMNNLDDYIRHQPALAASPAPSEKPSESAAATSTIVVTAISVDSRQTEAPQESGPLRGKCDHPPEKTSTADTSGVPIRADAAPSESSRQTDERSQESGTLRGDYERMAMEWLDLADAIERGEPIKWLDLAAAIERGEHER
jgi:hypothetical protein